MLSKWVWPLCILLVLGFVGCAPEAEEPIVEEPVAEAPEFDSAEFRRTTSARMDQLEQEMNQLQERVTAAGEQADAELNEEMAEWRRNFDALQMRVQEFEGQSEQEWREFESSINAEIEDLDGALDRFTERLQPES